MNYEQLMSTRKIPSECPFCGKREFKIKFFEVHYYDTEKKKLIEKVIDDGLQIFCAWCDEEIRVEDVVK